MARDLRGLDEVAIRKRLAPLAVAASQPVNGEIREVDDQIVAFESASGMSSAVMRARLDRGEITETWDVVRWLMALDLRDRLASLP